MISTYILAVVLASAIVTWIPRVLPFFIVKFVNLPEKFVEFLGYLPITIIFALILSSVFSTGIGQMPVFQWKEGLAILPTLAVMVKTRNIMLAVVTGIVCLALLRLFFGV